MKKVSIIEYSTRPDFHLAMSVKLYHLLCETIENEILKKYEFPKIKSSILEILIDAEVDSAERRVVQLSKTTRGEYFSFRFFLPYSIVVKNGSLNITAFIHEFMEGVRTAIAPFNIVPNEWIDRIKEQLITETSRNKEYEHVKSTDELAMENVLEKFREMRKSEKI